MAKQTLSISVNNLASGQDKEVTEFWEYCLPIFRYIYLSTLRPINVTSDQAGDHASDFMVKIMSILKMFHGWSIDAVLNYVVVSAFNNSRAILEIEIKRGSISYQQLRSYASWLGPATIVNKHGSVIEVASHPLKADPWQHVAELIAVADALEQLDERERDVFYLRYIFGWSIEETAIITGLSEVNVKAIGSRTRKKIKKAI